MGLEVTQMTTKHQAGLALGMLVERSLTDSFCISSSGTRFVHLGGAVVLCSVEPGTVLDGYLGILRRGALREPVQ